MYHHSVLSHLPSTHSANSHITKYGSTANSLNKASAGATGIINRSFSSENNRLRLTQTIFLDPTSFEGKKRTLDDQLAKLDSQLDSQLLSKVGVNVVLHGLTPSGVMTHGISGASVASFNSNVSPASNTTICSHALSNPGGVSHNLNAQSIRSRSHLASLSTGLDRLPNNCPAPSPESETFY